MITFYLVLRHALADDVKKFIDENSTSETKFLITQEKCKNSHKETDGEHFHIVIEWDDKTYNKFKRDVITKIWKLKGQARDGIGRQYGKEKVETEDDMVSYVLKDQTEDLSGCYYQIYTKEYLIERYKESYKKEDRFTLMDEVIEHLKIMPCMAPPIDIFKIQLTILEYWMKNTNKIITKSTLNHITIRFLTQTYQHHTDQDYSIILQYILGKMA